MLPLLLAAASHGCGAGQELDPAPEAPPAVAATPTPPPTPPPTPTRAPLRGLLPGQYRVCTIAFNSANELDAFQSSLPREDFDFLDLTPTHAYGEIPEGSPPAVTGAEPAHSDVPHWLLNWCRPDLHCDIMVLSGEFAGGFFGRYGSFLDVREIEEAACHDACSGLFRDPLEVFLLACNTLATKAGDERTPEQYLQVLLSHGFSRSAAERVVDLRYGPLGPSFRESVRRSFLAVPRIYGFSSVAPRGEVTGPFLKEYFRRKGNYARFLARSEGDAGPNRDMLEAFAATSLVQTSGLVSGEAAAADRNLVCALYDDRLPVAERLLIVRKLFVRPDFFSFVPTIEVFLARHDPEGFSGDERRLFAEIQALDTPRRQMTDLMYSLNVSALKMQMAHLAEQLGWIRRDEFFRLAVEGTRDLLKEPVSSEIVDIACDLTRYAPTGVGLKSEEIPGEFFLYPEGFRMIDCLAPADSRLNVRMLPGMQSQYEPMRLWASYALSKRVPLEEPILQGLVPYLNDSSAGVRERVKWILGAQMPLPASVMTAVRDYAPAVARELETP